MHAFVEQMLSLESEDSEDDGTRVDGREGVAGRDEEDVTDTVGARSIVAAKGYDGTQGQAVGVEDLKADNKNVTIQNETFSSLFSMSIRIQVTYLLN